MTSDIVLVTTNSTYVFTPCGEDRYTMISTNPKYAGPTKVRFVDPPMVGQRVLLMRLSGSRVGHLLSLSKLRDIITHGGQK